jgi:hypothetical protein
LEVNVHYIPILSTIVTFAFAAAVLRRWSYKKGPHLLLWGLGLIWYGLGTLSEVILAFTFNPLVLKLWYLSGAMLTAAWLGQGTVYLLVRKRRVADILMAFLGFASLAAFLLLLLAPVTPAAAAYNTSLPASTQYKDILVRNGWIILLTILLNIYGTLALVGGAIYSAFLFWRKHVLVERMLGNILIAVGALMPALGGSFVRAGLPDFLYLSEFLGVVIMYGGFTLATSTRPAERSVIASAY